MLISHLNCSTIVLLRGLYSIAVPVLTQKHGSNVCACAEVYRHAIAPGRVTKWRENLKAGGRGVPPDGCYRRAVMQTFMIGGLLICAVSNVWCCLVTSCVTVEFMVHDFLLADFLFPTS